jgi:hypothetical protein
MSITFNNYHFKTEAVFKGCKIPKRKPDFVSNSGSKYWHGIDKNGAYVIRHSDHWVNIKEIGKNDIKKQCKKIATCQWHLKTNDSMAGKAYLINFKSI